ncbi:hypothetical protein [Marinobacterium sediminicola]|uniref:Tryptophan synthase subunit beta like protein n=1 Tax=Marinobacterium sediminicola TaxID=518898 RepID=A0ABY1RXV1_9GAMM|nr:hypothetical protein [Marinobacterium sediminicola]ULG68593.1 hypothetical protein LN244_12935 [Marinobacterium sediminicola]SMR73111.1 hypothetical protein SAMN04487964_10352 [Marinobacterium sediminicola]
MLYALRDKDGKITALTDRAIPDAQPANPSDPEVMAFLSLDGENFAANDFLDESDLSTIRILEDLIDTLIDRQIIRFTDLPAAAQRKLLSRKVARSLANPDSEDPGSSDYVQDNMFIREDEQLF